MTHHKVAGWYGKTAFFAGGVRPVSYLDIGEQTVGITKAQGLWRAFRAPRFSPYLIDSFPSSMALKAKSKAGAQHEAVEHVRTYLRKTLRGLPK